MSNTTTMTLYATERAIGCRSSMSSSSSNEKFFSPPVDHPKAQLPYVSLSTLSRYTRKTLVHHHHPRRFLRARRCTQPQSNNTNLARANSKSVSRGLLQIQTRSFPERARPRVGRCPQTTTAKSWTRVVVVP